MNRSKNLLWSKFALRAVIVAIIVAVSALYFSSLDLSPDLSYLDVKILSGSAEGNYFAIVEHLSNEASRQKGKIENIASQGSLENLRRLVSSEKNCEVQFGLVQSGFEWQEYPQLQVIGRVGHKESLLFLGRNGDAIHRLAEISGLKIGIGSKESGTAYIAERFFKVLGIASLNNTFSYHPLDQQIALLESRGLDLGVFVIDAGSELIARAVRDQNLQIVGFNNMQAVVDNLPFGHFGTIVAGQFDPLRELPPVSKPILQLDTLLLSNHCASHSDIVGLMTVLHQLNPTFIDRNRTARTPSGLSLSESAREFFENHGASVTDEYLPWLVDIMPPSNWVYTFMAVSLFFNLAGLLNSLRLALIDQQRVALEDDLRSLFGASLSNEEIREFDPRDSVRNIDVMQIDHLIAAYKRHMAVCRSQSLSLFSPLGEEMGYRDQEIIMTLTLDALRSLRTRLFADDHPRGYEVSGQTAINNNN